MPQSLSKDSLKEGDSGYGEAYRARREKMREVKVLSLAEKVDPEHTALIVVDVQNDFCADGGALHRWGRDVSMIQAMLPCLVDFIDQAREAGVFVVFIRELGDEPYLSPFMLERRRKQGRLGEQFILEGTWGADF